MIKSYYCTIRISQWVSLVWLGGAGEGGASPPPTHHPCGSLVGYQCAITLPGYSVSECPSVENLCWHLLHVAPAIST